VEQRDISGAIRIVFERRDDCGIPSRVRFEIDQAEPPLVAAAAMARVIRPRLLRPPVRLTGTSRFFSGSLSLSSEKSAICMKRWPGCADLVV